VLVATIKKNKNNKLIGSAASVMYIVLLVRYVCIKTTGEGKEKRKIKNVNKKTFHKTLDNNSII